MVLKKPWKKPVHLRDGWCKTWSHCCIHVRVIGETSVNKKRTFIQNHTVSHGTLMPRWVKIDTRVGLQWDSADLRAGASFKSIKQPFLLIKMLSRGHSNLWSPHTWNISESGMPLFWWKWPNFQNTNNQVSNGHNYMVQVQSILTFSFGTGTYVPFNGSKLTLNPVPSHCHTKTLPATSLHKIACSTKTVFAVKTQVINIGQMLW